MDVHASSLHFLNLVIDLLQVVHSVKQNVLPLVESVKTAFLLLGILGGDDLLVQPFKLLKLLLSLLVDFGNHL